MTIQNISPIYSRHTRAITLAFLLAICLTILPSYSQAATPSIKVNKASLIGTNNDLTITYTVFIEEKAGDTSKYGVGFVVNADGRRMNTIAVPITPTSTPQIRRMTVNLSTVAPDVSPEKVTIEAAAVVRNPGKSEQIIATEQKIAVPVEASEEPFDPDLGYELIRKELPSLRQNFVGVLFGFLERVFWPMFIIIAIVISGIMYIMARGDEDKAKKAKNYLLATISVIVIFRLGYWALDIISVFVRQILEGYKF